MASTETETLKKELMDLFKMIQRIRQEIASIKSPQDHFSDMTDQLDAIVGSTAIATNEIMKNVEKINDIAFELKKGGVENQQASLDEVIERVGNVIVSCSFQDITGQRISKVIKALRYVEDKVNSLVSMWGQDQIAQEKVEGAPKPTGEAALLSGPALPGQGLDQSAADKLFAGGTATVAAAAPVAAAAVAAEAVAEATPAPTPVAAEAVAETPAPAAAEAVAVAETPAPAANAPEPEAAPEEAPADEDEPLDQNSIDALFG